MVQIPQMVDLPTGQTIDSRLRALSSSRLCIFCQSGQKAVSALRYNTRTQPQRKQQPITGWIRLCIYIYIYISIHSSVKISKHKPIKKRVIRQSIYI